MAQQKVTAGREALGDFAPKFAELNDDVLFGEIWSRGKAAFSSRTALNHGDGADERGVLDSSLSFHLQKAKENGITREEIAEVLTQLAFYSGWPKAWAAFRMAKEIWTAD